MPMRKAETLAAQGSIAGKLGASRRRKQGMLDEIMGVKKKKKKKKVVDK